MALIATKVNNSASDNTRLIKGKYIMSAGGAAATLDGDYIICDLPKRALITALILDVATGMTAATTGTVTLGYKEPGLAISVAGLASSATLTPTATGCKVPNASKYFDNGGVVTLSVTNGDSVAAFKGRVFVEYAVVC
jgi:hypothetical protein